MLKHVTDYYHPIDIGEALALYRHYTGRAALVGGGLDLSWRPRTSISVLVDLDRAGLAYIEEREGAIAIGATTTIRQLSSAPELMAYRHGFLPGILKQVATSLLRGLITVGGAVARAYPWADLPCLLLGLEAQVVLFDGSIQTLALTDFYHSRFQEMLKSAIIQEILLPAGPSGRAAYQRFTRSEVDIPLLNQFLAVDWRDGKVSRAVALLGGRPGFPLRLGAVEAAILGSSLDEKTVEQATRILAESAEVDGDFRLGGDYRRHLAAALLVRNLEEVRQYAA